MTDSDNAHRRKKQPEVVRRALLDEAAKLATREGLASVTVQAVAEAAGVTKGGFIHHFPNKQALIDTLCSELLDKIDDQIDGQMANDPEVRGRFTRAYLKSVFEAGTAGKLSPWAVLSISMLTDANLRRHWTKWFEGRLERHAETDGGVDLHIVRLAADGIWISDLFEMRTGDRRDLLDRLLAATSSE
ncbi:TetR/AcrR family transcriptional regulator [Devosia sediminis]|uniref:TetR/AcrR family transcriptional regulator n=1 Tax=Devosia sediminis TaxID=2798801 RepID=A0A934J090_9HYPH|nr:TetR/AcrR family transcriptional regulator [Devosia sediminis]MBJ3786385.1 TetR/AcrR family transcriptional regulator [Devosia sediminis]